MRGVDEGWARQSGTPVISEGHTSCSPEAVANTVEIARRCAFKAETRDPILPKFADDEVEELRRQAEDRRERPPAVAAKASCTVFPRADACANSVP